MLEACTGAGAGTQVLAGAQWERPREQVTAGLGGCSHHWGTEEGPPRAGGAAAKMQPLAHVPTRTTCGLHSGSESEAPSCKGRLSGQQGGECERWGGESNEEESPLGTVQVTGGFPGVMEASSQEGGCLSQQGPGPPHLCGMAGEHPGVLFIFYYYF